MLFSFSHEQISANSYERRKFQVLRKARNFHGNWFRQFWSLQKIISTVHSFTSVRRHVWNSVSWNGERQREKSIQRNKKMSCHKRIIIVIIVKMLFVLLLKCVFVLRYYYEWTHQSVKNEHRKKYTLKQQTLSSNDIVRWFFLSCLEYFSRVNQKWQWEENMRLLYSFLQTKTNVNSCIDHEIEYFL